MGIINLSPPVTPTPPTPAQLLAQTAAQHQARMQNLWGQLQREFTNLTAFVWANSNATPQQAFDAFATNAGDLFNLANAYGAMVQAYSGTAPPSPVPAGYSYTINADGTVTVTSPPAPTPAAAS